MRQKKRLVVIKLLALKSKIKTITNYAQKITLIHQDNSKTTLASSSRDDDDIIKTVLLHLRAKH